MVTSSRKDHFDVQKMYSQSYYWYIFEVNLEYPEKLTWNA